MLADKKPIGEGRQKNETAQTITLKIQTAPTGRPNPDAKSDLFVGETMSESKHTTKKIMMACDTHGDWNILTAVGCPNCVIDMRKDLAALKARNAELITALKDINEYWNGNENERAMTDALYHIIKVADDILANEKGQG